METQQLLQRLRDEAAVLAELSPHDWQAWADHLRRLGQLVHTSADLRNQVAVQHRESAWTTWQVIVDQWHKTYFGDFTHTLDDARSLLRSGDVSGLETVLEFLEADPYFYRSGYLKAELIPYVTRFAPFAEGTAVRLRQVVSNRVNTFWGREFPYYKRLAKAVDSSDFRETLNVLANDSDTAVQVRALSILRHLDGDPKLSYRRREHRGRRRKSVSRLRPILP